MRATLRGSLLLLAGLGAFAFIMAEVSEGAKISPGRKSTPTTQEDHISVSGPRAATVPFLRTGALAIKVVSGTGEPAASAWVEVTPMAGTTTGYKTGADGKLFLGPLTVGEYLVVVFEPDFRDFHWRIVRISAGTVSAERFDLDTTGK